MNLKSLLLTLTILASALINGAERPPQPTNLPWETEATQKPQQVRQRLNGLPIEIQREILNTYFFQAYPNLRAMTQRIVEFKDKVSEGSMLQLLENLRTANAIDLGKRLKELPIMHSQKLVEWLNMAQKKLMNDDEFYDAIRCMNVQGIKEYLSELLNQKNINVNWQDKSGGSTQWTPLIMAVSKDNIDAVKKLLSVAANPDLHDKGGWTALMHAAHKGNTEIIELLLAAGANPALKSIHGNNAAYIAKEKGYTQIVPILEKAIAQWNAQQEKK